MIRQFVIAACLVLTPCDLAAAQDSKPADDAAAVDSLAPEHIAAAREMFDSIVFDNGLLATLSDGIAEREMPELRASMLSSPLYTSATPEHQAALTAFMESMPDVMRSELTSMFNEIGDRAAPRFASRIEADDLRGISAFMRSPEMLALWQDLMQNYLKSGRALGGTFPDWSNSTDATFTEFASTPSGRAFLREQDFLTQVLEEEINGAIVRIVPRIQVRVLSGICDALGDECPARLRDSVGPI